MKLKCIGKSKKVKESETYWVRNYRNVVPHSTVKRRFLFLPCQGPLIPFTKAINTHWSL